MTDRQRYRPETVAEAGHYLSSWLEYQRDLLRTPGVQIAIRVGDQTVYSGAFGYADQPQGAALRTDHLFRIASHSKTFTATAIMQLVEASKIRLDDPISSHLPDIADSGLADVTVRELMGHQGGVIRDSVDKDFWQLMVPFPDRRQVIDLVNGHGRIFDRNEHFKYSNVGYSLLGLAIEAVTGQSYADYTREHIVDPLGLTDTGPEYDSARADDYAAGHTGLLHGTDVRETIEHVDTSGMASATGFYSTAEDLTRYGAAHFLGAEELITDTSKRLLQREESVVTAYGREHGRYGLGFSHTRIGDRDWLGHSGGYPGHITVTYIEPREQVVVSVLTNCLGGPAAALGQGVIKLLDLAADAPETATPAGIDARGFTGRFANLWGVTDIALLGGRLVGLTAGAADPTEIVDELEIVDEDTLVVRPVPGYGTAGEPVEVTRDDAGKPESVRYGGASRWPLSDFAERRSAMISPSAD